MTTSLRYRAVAARSETTPGTDIIAGSPAAYYLSTTGDAPRIAPVREVVEDQSVGAQHSGRRHRTYGSHCQVELPTHMRGKTAAAGTGPIHAPLLKAAGFKEVLTPATSATYTLCTYHTVAGGAPPMTVYEDTYDSDGQYRRGISTGVRGNLNVNLAMNEAANLNFSGVGLFNQIAAPASGAPPAITDGDKPLLLVRALTLEIGGDPYCLTNVEFGTNWSVEQIMGTCGANALKEVHLVRPSGSRAGGTLTFQEVAALTEVLTSYAADTPATFEAVLADGTDTITITGLIQFGNFTRGGGNIVEYSVPFFFIGDSGDDDIIITYT